MAETMFASLEKELLLRERLATRGAGRMLPFRHVECFYTTGCHHSGLGYLSPAASEQQHLHEAIPARA